MPPSSALRTTARDESVHRQEASIEESVEIIERSTSQWGTSERMDRDHGNRPDHLHVPSVNVSVRELRRQVEQSKFTFRDGSALLPECSIIKEKAVSQLANSSKQPGIASSSHVSGNGASSEASFDHRKPSTSTHADMLVQRLAAKHKEAGKQIRKIYREQFESVHYKEECLKYQSERLQRSLRVRVPLEAHQPARLKSVMYPAGIDTSQVSRFGDDYKGNLEVLTMPTGDCGFNLTLQKE